MRTNDSRTEVSSCYTMRKNNKKGKHCYRFAVSAEATSPNRFLIVVDSEQYFHKFGGGLEEDWSSIFLYFH